MEGGGGGGGGRGGMGGREVVMCFYVVENASFGLFASQIDTMAEEGDDKKGLFHKLKALKRRTAQVIAHKIGGAENTIDET
jgi:hypothetical protein